MQTAKITQNLITWPSVEAQKSSPISEVILFADKHTNHLLSSIIMQTLAGPCQPSHNFEAPAFYVFSIGW